MNFQDKNIIITGGAGIGVGGGVCQAIDQLGGHLIIVDMDSNKVRSAEKKYNQAQGYVADISQQSEVIALFKQLKADYREIHGLVNNAGVGLSQEARFTSEMEFDHLFAVNFKAVWMCSKHYANLLEHRKQKGRIVNISSIHAHATTHRYALYCSTKNAVEGLTRGLSVELGRYGIRVNAVGPGYVHAEQNFDLIKTWTDDPEKWVENYQKNQQVIERLLDPIEVGNVVAFLLSDYSEGVTGQTLYIDHGTTSLLFNRDFSE